MKRWTVISVVAVLVTATSAFADSVVDGTIDVSNVRTQGSDWRVNVTDTNQSITYNGWAGAYKIDLSNKSTDAPSDVNAGSDQLLYCMELAEYSGSGTHNIDAPENAPVPYTGPPGPAPIGSAKANLLKHLFTDVTDPSSQTTTQQVAFQLAIWEIVHEVTTNSGAEGDPTQYSLNDDDGGNFFATSTATSGAIAGANTLLSGLSTTGDRAVLYALTNDGDQDYLYRGTGTEETAVVPSPGALVQLMGLGLLVGVVAFRRRRRA